MVIATQLIRKAYPYLVPSLGTGRLVFGMTLGRSNEVYGTAAAATMPGLLVRWPIPESLHARARADSKVTGGCAAELQRNAIAAIVNVLAAHHCAVHITLSLLCGEQRTQNRQREALENRTGSLGRAIHVISAGRRLQND